MLKSLACAAVAASLSTLVDLSAQSKYMEQYMMPDPQTWGMIKYGGQTPDLYTGTVRAEIPIYTYKDPDFEIPISLSYASNGYMPNVQANFVGLGWTLNAGGCITRRVRGIEDEGRKSVAGSYIDGYLHYLNDSTGGSSRIQDRPVGFNGELCYTSGSCYYETTPDVYMFNFLGMTGKFMIDLDGNAVVYDCNIPSGELSVDLSGLLDDGLSVSYPSSSISIYDAMGYRYDFGNIYGDDVTLNQIRESTAAYGYESLPYSENWYLRSIVAPNGRTVTFNYLDDAEEIASQRMFPFCQVSSYSTKYSSIDGRRCWLVNLSSSTSGTGAVFSAYQVKDTRYLPIPSSIQVDTVCEVRFDYLSRKKEKYKMGNASPATLSTPMRLARFSVHDLMSGSELKSASLIYDYSSDMGNPVMFLKAVEVSGVGKYSMSYVDEVGEYPYHGSCAYDHWGYLNSNVDMDISSLVPSVSVSCDSFEETIEGNTRDPNPSCASRGMLVRMDYPTGGWSTFEYEPHRYSKIVTRDISSASRGWPYLRPLSESKIAGGVRIRKITDHASDGVSTTKEYLYADSGRSSGIMLEFPRYSCIWTSRNTDSTHVSHMEKYTADVPGYIMDRTHIGYSTVKEVYPDGSYTRYEFTDYADYPDFQGSEDVVRIESKNLYPIRPSVEMFKPDPEGVFFREAQSMYVCRGRMKAKTEYGADGDMMRRETYVYGDAPRDTTSVISSIALSGNYCYVVNMYLGQGKLIRSSVSCPGGVTDSLSFAYNAMNQMVCSERTYPDGTMESDWNIYVQDIPSVARTSVEEAMVLRNQISVPIYTAKTRTDRQGVTSLITANRTMFETSTTVGRTLYVPGKNMIASISSNSTLLNGSVATVTSAIVGKTYRTVASYGSFNSHGRPCSVTDSNGIQSLLLWGYGGLYPAALIGNCTQSRLSSAGVSLTSDLSSSDHINSLDPILRSIPGASVTTWKYLPFVGVTEKKGPDGRKTSYEYDSHGRLISVKDDYSETMNEYVYFLEPTTTINPDENH